ncbi:MAG: hypothetical protein QME66_01985 [Candidatus Eisenbacteria bacterium]|nr:hypothetical protein [Candidatus Eisenbacteria bacterium]
MKKSLSFLGRFFVAAIPLFTLWHFVSYYYLVLMAKTAGVFFHILGYDSSILEVSSKTVLISLAHGGLRASLNPSMTLDKLPLNLVFFIALAFATGHRKLKRTVKGISYSVPIFFALHVLTYVLFSLHSFHSGVLEGSLHRETIPPYVLFPTLFLQGLAPVLPFLLWFLLVPGGPLYDMRERRLKIAARDIAKGDRKRFKKTSSQKN